MLPEGITELKMGDVPEKLQKLNRYGTIQTKLFLERGTLLESSLQRQHQLDGIADHTGDDEHDHL